MMADLMALFALLVFVAAHWRMIYLEMRDNEELRRRLTRAEAALVAAGWASYKRDDDGHLVFIYKVRNEE